MNKKALTTHRAKKHGVRQFSFVQGLQCPFCPGEKSAFSSRQALVKHLWCCMAPGAENARLRQKSGAGITPVVDLSAEAGSQVDASMVSGGQPEVIDISSESDHDVCESRPRKMRRYIQLHPYSDPVLLGYDLA